MNLNLKIILWKKIEIMELNRLIVVVKNMKMTMMMMTQVEKIIQIFILKLEKENQWY